MIRTFFKPRRILTYLLALVVAVGFIGENARVFAIPDPDFYSGNDILYYDPEFRGACAAGGGSLVGANTKEKIWNYLIGRELTPEQAAGVMGNMQAESGLSPTARQGSTDLFNSNFNNNAWGLVQWDGGRRFTSPNKGVLGKLRDEKPDLVKYTAYEYRAIKEPNDQIPQADFDALLLFELEYMYEESQSRRVTEDRYGKGENEWETLKMMDSVEKATVFWHNNFEVSADSPERVLATRGGAAKGFLDELGGTSTEGSPTNCAGGTAIQNLARQYAWPEYHAPVFLDKTDAYADAVSAATSESRYVGGCNESGCNPGIDCGGFVTLLVTDSGYDPEYNYEGRGGNTTSQKRWLDENWDNIGVGGSKTSDKLQPGDVAIAANGNVNHTYVYVGEMEDFGGNGSTPGIVSASIGSTWRAPMAGRESVSDPTYTWYSKKD